MDIPLWKFIALFLAFLSFGAALYFFFASKMIDNTDNIIFLLQEETQKILDDNVDRYYETFHEKDFLVRKIKNVKEYLAKISKSGCNGSEENKQKIIDCIHKIHSKLHSKIEDSIYGVQLSKLLNLPWNIGFVCDKYYENGLPHTRGNVIILSNKDVSTRNIFELCRLLLHEKVHIYQKEYKEEFLVELLKEYEVIEDIDKSTTNIRANPDTDNFVYKRKSDGKVLKTTYRKNPTNFNDVKYPDNDHSLEHPFEYVAYHLEKLYE